MPPKSDKKTIGAVVAGGVEFSEFKKLVERCGSMASLDRDGLAALIPTNAAFATLSATTKQRLATDASFCKRVVDCQTAGFDCVAAIAPDAKLGAGVNGGGNIVSYTMNGITGRATDVEVENGVLLVTPAFIEEPAADAAPGRVSLEVVNAHRESHENGIHEAPPPGESIISAADVIRTGTELTDFRALIEEAQLPMPSDDADGVVLVIPNGFLRAMPKERLAKLRANKAELRRILQCHLDVATCFQGTLKALPVEMTEDGPGVRFGNVVAYAGDAPRLPHGAVLVAKDFVQPPATFRRSK